MDISVIVPFCNAADHIESCIEALLSQAFPADLYEVIMVDNGSTDASSSIVRRYPRIKLVSEPKRGAYAARNRGLAAAEGAIIAFTDADCVPAPSWLQNIADALEDARVSLALGRVLNRSSWSLTLLSAYEHQRALYIFGGNTRELYYGYTNNMAVRRAVFDALGPFPEVARGADVVLVRRVVDKDTPDAVRYAPDVVVEHLEITGFLAWSRKMFIYGRSSLYYRATPATRTLNRAEKLEVFRRTLRGQRYSGAAGGLLFVLLTLGVVLHILGRWSGIVFRGRSPGQPSSVPE